jgi:predicted nucleotidyltransferase
MNLDLTSVRNQRGDILRLAAKYGVRNVRAFGSVARGTARSDSDLDVLVNFESGRSLLDLIGFEQDLGELLGCKVDVVLDGGVSPYMEDRIYGEAVAL